MNVSVIEISTTWTAGPFAGCASAARAGSIETGGKTGFIGPKGRFCPRHGTARTDYQQRPGPLLLRIEHVPARAGGICSGSVRVLRNLRGRRPFSLHGYETRILAFMCVARRQLRPDAAFAADQRQGRQFNSLRIPNSGSEGAGAS